jgi:alpha-tubulin suppressor-like RCC1 family protein
VLGGDNAQLAAGVDHSLVLKADGSAMAFGYNAYGQLGDGSTTGRHSPVEVGDLAATTRSWRQAVSTRSSGRSAAKRHGRRAQRL